MLSDTGALEYNRSSNVNAVHFTFFVDTGRISGYGSRII